MGPGDPARTALADPRVADLVVVDLPNPITGGRSSNTVYLATGPRES